MCTFLTFTTNLTFDTKQWKQRRKLNACCNIPITCGITKFVEAFKNINFPDLLMTAAIFQLEKVLVRISATGESPFLVLQILQSRRSLVIGDWFSARNVALVNAIQGLAE